MPTSEVIKMKTLITILVLTTFSIAPSLVVAGEGKKTTTTSQAAQAKAREGKTGTSNKNASKGLSRAMGEINKQGAKKKDSPKPKQHN